MEKHKIKLKNMEKKEDYIAYSRRLKSIKPGINSLTSIILRWFYMFLPSLKDLYGLFQKIDRPIKLILWG